jgi:hypothetical protein
MSDFMVKAKENAVVLAQETKKVTGLALIGFILFQLWDVASGPLFNTLCTNYSITCDVENTKWYGIVALAVAFLSRLVKP